MWILILLFLLSVINLAAGIFLETNSFWIRSVSFFAAGFCGCGFTYHLLNKILESRGDRMDDIQRIKKQFQDEPRLWTKELWRGERLLEKAKNHQMRKAAKVVIKDAKKGINRTEENLDKLVKIKEELRALAVFKKPVREIV